MTGTQKNMYANGRTWNPFKGCGFDCTYCGPSFKAQSKRQKHLCDKCYRYTPHCHEDRLRKIPGAEIVFVCGNADISFCPPAFTRRIIEAIKMHLPQCRSDKTFYFQSKKPAYFQQFLDEFPPEVILLTTLETNRDVGYKAISKAPPPSERYRQFKALTYPRKVVTIEPILDFDPGTFFKWIVDLHPEYVWLGFNSKPKLALPDPSPDKVRTFMERLSRAGIEVRGKTLRGLKVPA